MNIVLVSNFLNLHQTPLCEAFCSTPDVHFTFLACDKPTEWKSNAKMVFTESPYLFQLDEDKSNLKEAKEIVNKADLLIVGSAYEPLVADFIKANKLVFRYAEHPFKTHDFPILRRANLYRRHHDEARRNVYLLCASSFTAKQYNSAMLFKDKCLKFGYFPNGNIFDTNLDCKTMIHEGPLEIMWAGIFIDWKHPEMALLAADELYKHGIDFHLTMVGYGDEHKNIDPAVAARPYHDKITITGNMTNKDTLKLMAKTDVYLFTSDIGEGWGAVLNESMSSGCAVLASKQAGSTNYLVKDGVNGMTYSGRGEFVKKLLFLAKNREEATRIGQAARKTIVDVWNGRVAVQNLLRAYEILQKKESITKDMINGGPSTFIR